MLAYVYNHAYVIWSHVCACMFVSSGVEVYVYIHLQIGLYVCMVCVNVCMHLYVSIHDIYNFMSVCERCM